MKICISTILMAVATAAPAETLWPSPNTVMRAQSDSSIVMLEDGSVSVTTGTEARWPGVRMDFVKGEADLSRFGRFRVAVSNTTSRFGRFRVAVSNTTHETRTVHLSVKGRNVQGQGKRGGHTVS